MGKLLKYELQKTLKTKIGVCITTMALQILFLFAIYQYDPFNEDSNPNLLGISMALLILVVAVGQIVVAFHSIFLLSADLNKKQSYMLYLTPNSSYKILGAKFLEAAISIGIVGGFFLAIIVWDVNILSIKFKSEFSMLELLAEIMGRTPLYNEIVEVFTPLALTSSISYFASWWLATVLTGYLAVAISSTCLNGKKINKLLSVGIFVAITWFRTWLFAKIDFGEIGFTIQNFIYSAIWIGISIAFYFIAASIMEKKLSV